MLKKVDIKRSLACLKLKWEDSILFDRYFILLYPLGLMAVAITFFIGEASLLSILSLILTTGLLVLWVYNIHINDKLTKIPFNGSFLELRKLIETKAQQYDWQIFRNNTQLITGYKTRKWVVGSKVTILFDKQTILINVQNLDGIKGYFPFSFGRNKKLTNQLIKIIEQSA